MQPKKQKRKVIKAWAISDWGGGIKHPSVSIFDTKRDAICGLKKMDKLPDPVGYGNKRNKVVPVEITILT